MKASKGNDDKIAIQERLKTQGRSMGEQNEGMSRWSS